MPPGRQQIEAWIRNKLDHRIDKMIGDEVDGVQFKNVSLGPDRVYISQELMRGATGRCIRSIKISKALDVIEAAGCELTDIPCVKAALVARWPELQVLIDELDL